MVFVILLKFLGWSLWGCIVHKKLQNFFFYFFRQKSPAAQRILIQSRGKSLSLLSGKVTTFIMPQARLHNKWLRKKLNVKNWLPTRNNFLRGVHPAGFWKQLTESRYLCSENEYPVFVSFITFLGWSLWDFIIHRKWQNFIPTLSSFLT